MTFNQYDLYISKCTGGEPPQYLSSALSLYLADVRYMSKYGNRAQRRVAKARLKKRNLIY